jgi:hypothetical protein
MAEIHQAAAEGYTAKAEAYIRGRPEYPAEVQDWLRDDLALKAGKTVLDLGPARENSCLISAPRVLW